MVIKALKAEADNLLSGIPGYSTVKVLVENTNAHLEKRHNEFVDLL